MIPNDLMRVPLRTGERFSHSTAARLYGLPLPTALERRIHVTTPPGIAPSRHRLRCGHHDDGEHLRRLHGLPVSTPEQTFIELGRLLDLDALVAVGDHLVHSPRFVEAGRPWTTIERLHTACAARRAGVVQARQALTLVRTGVESPMETALRLMLTRAGLPEPVCGYELRQDGRRIGWFDLAWPDRKVLGEYDGDQHRTSDEQYEKDIRRFDAAADIDWRVIRVRKARMRRAARPATIDRFRQALAHPLPVPLPSPEK